MLLPSRYRRAGWNAPPGGPGAQTLTQLPDELLAVVLKFLDVPSRCVQTKANFPVTYVVVIKCLRLDSGDFQPGVDTALRCSAGRELQWFASLWRLLSCSPARLSGATSTCWRFGQRSRTGRTLSIMMSCSRVAAVRMLCCDGGGGMLQGSTVSYCLHDSCSTRRVGSVGIMHVIEDMGPNVIISGALRICCNKCSDASAALQRIQGGHSAIAGRDLDDDEIVERQLLPLLLGMLAFDPGELLLLHGSASSHRHWRALLWNARQRCDGLARREWLPSEVPRRIKPGNVHLWHCRHAEATGHWPA